MRKKTLFQLSTASFQTTLLLYIVTTLLLVCKLSLIDLQ